ncbi:MAG: Mur ligase family protein [Brevinematales bacterium]|nr:Mur ligase family protein [Brevinematales bacterium]
MSETNYHKTLEYIYTLTDFENSRRFKNITGFQNVEKTLDLLSINYKSKNIIHVAGTKGKGTVSYFCSYLMSKFLKQEVGLYTSPHLLSVNERISILENGIKRDISNEDFSEIATIVREVIEKNNIELTTFDFLTVMAMVYFENKGIHDIVLEVGLGGRLDSTNFCTPKVSVITLIDYDHANVLGKTLDKIAYEKAGIIKPNIPVVSSSQRKSARKTIEEVSRIKNCELTFINDIYKILKTEVNSEGTIATVKHIPSENVFNISTTMIGKHFVENILVSYEAVRKIFDIPAHYIQSLPVRIKGRFDILKLRPLIVFDVAHSPKSVNAVIENYLKILNYDKFKLIASFMNDKDIKRISKVIGKYRNYIQKVEIIKQTSSDGSNTLKSELSEIGFRNISVSDQVNCENINTLIIGSFRLYENVINELGM